MLRKLVARFDAAVFNPAGVPDDVVLGLALAPPVAAGLLLFRLPALQMLGIALLIGGIAHALARLTRQPLEMSPVLPAVIGVALLGPGNMVWAPVVASAGVILELIRARFLPLLRAQTGLLAYGAVFLAGHGATSGYLAPLTARILPEPIRVWLTYFGGAAQPVDPVRLYVGNVPGPVFATSLMAVAVAAAWLWYARRLSLAVLAGFLAGGIGSALYFGWSPVFQLDSGPLWFAAVLLADRRLLPGLMPVRPFIGAAAGLAAVGVRSRGVAIEGAFLVVAGVQLLLGLGDGAAWAVMQRGAVIARLRGRRHPQPQLSLPAVIPRAAGEGSTGARRRSA
ncbi:MAG: hypothetical protein ACREPA_04060 [Candidatus Dormibacteraceae bacterium]